MANRIKVLQASSVREKGAVMLIMASAMVMLLGVTALVVDVANYQQLKRQAQASVDASVLAGALDIASYEDAAGFVIEYAGRNMDVPAAAWVGCFDDGKDIDVFTLDQTYDCISISENGLSLRVKLPTQTADTSFARIFGFDQWNINVSASAEVVLATENTGSGPWVDPFDPDTGADYDIRQGYAGGGYPQCSNKDDLQWVPTSGSTINALQWVSETGSKVELGTEGTLYMAVREVAVPSDAIASRDIAHPDIAGHRAKGDTTTTTTDPDAPTTTTTTTIPGDGTPGTKWVEAIFVFEHTDGTVTVLCTSSGENVDNAGASNIAVLWGIGGADKSIRAVGEAQRAFDLDTFDDKAGKFPNNGMLMHISCSESWKNATQDSTTYPPENGWANPGKGQPEMPDPEGHWDEPKAKGDTAVYSETGLPEYESVGDPEWKVLRAIMVKMVVDADGNNVVDKNSPTDRNVCPGKDELIYTPGDPSDEVIPNTYIRLSD